MDGVIYQSASSRVDLSQASRPVAQKIHQRSSRSIALMREAVTMPKRLPRIKADIKHNKQTSRKQTNVFGSKSLKPDPVKSRRAEMVSRSSKISRFGSTANIHSPSIVPTVTKISASVRAISRPQLGLRSQAASVTASSMALAQPMPAMPNISNQKLEAMLDRALAQADAHKQVLSGRFSRNFWNRLGKSKAIALAIGLILALATALFIAYLHVPSFSVKVASLASGVEAHAPTYVPPGYSLSNTKFKNGDVNLTFTNGSQSFTISQQKSGLNEQALQNNVVAPASKLYQTSQYNGVTVYTYGSTTTPNSALNATLVNQGVKTTVTNKANLDSEQLSKIVQGLL